MIGSYIYSYHKIDNCELIRIASKYLAGSNHFRSIFKQNATLLIRIR